MKLDFSHKKVLKLQNEISSVIIQSTDIKIEGCHVTAFELAEVPEIYTSDFVDTLK